MIIDERRDHPLIVLPSQRDDQTAGYSFWLSKIAKWVALAARVAVAAATFSGVSAKSDNPDHRTGHAMLRQRVEHLLRHQLRARRCG